MGVSTIVATVLTILVTVATVTVVCLGITPVLEINVLSYDAQLLVVLVNGCLCLDVF